jgi:hypothetical protein
MCLTEFKKHIGMTNVKLNKYNNKLNKYKKCKDIKERWSLLSWLCPLHIVVRHLQDDSRYV